MTVRVSAPAGVTFRPTRSHRLRDDPTMARTERSYSKSYTIYQVDRPPIVSYNLTGLADPQPDEGYPWLN